VAPSRHKMNCCHQVIKRSSYSGPAGVVITKSTRGRHTVDQWGLLSPSRQKVVTQSTAGVAVTKSTQRGCRHQLDKKGVVITKSTGGRHTVDRRGCRHQVDRKGIVITKSTSCRHTVDQRGCRHQVDRRSSHSRPMGLPSPSRQEGDVVTRSTKGHHTVDRRSGDTKSPTQEGRGHQLNPRRKGGDTKSTHGEREGTPSQRTEKSQGVSTDRLKQVDYKGNAGLIPWVKQKRMDEEAQLSIDISEGKHYTYIHRKDHTQQSRVSQPSPKPTTSAGARPPPQHGGYKPPA